ncbi:MAG: Uma2 family endonuclease [Bacillota bacterium]|uniref:Uma2 family endonuclease n=1 Tax=Thermanaerosceptrum fracticalcis TaxID=1712410 RepID=A0A7G6DZB5_THEFR|nr:Uma2 family endonuclease [Thermanaerosceptrum fracticalcis]QNB45169.1 Uma2 family endonuclease [Thermanaerosceptrum fracticalcis]
MSSPIHHPERKYSYQDYLRWSDEERWELIDGVPYNITPSPSRKHQQILGELATEFTSYLRGKRCEAFIAPFDVRLFAEGKSDDQIMDVVQPDLFVICDPNKLDDKGCKGSPDLIIEILSPRTGKIDRWIKYKLYERAGVREYWIVEPVNSTIEVFTLNQNGRFELSGVYEDEDIIKVGIFDDLLIDLKVIFRE